VRFDRINGIFRINRILKGERACGPASFLGGWGMSEVRKFEMLKVARKVALRRDWIFAVFLVFGYSDLTRVFRGGSLQMIHVMGLLKT